MDQKRKDIIESVIRTWCRKLGIDNHRLFAVLNYFSKAGHEVVFCTDLLLSHKLFGIGGRCKDFYDTDTRYLEEEVNRWFEEKSLYILAYKYSELGCIDVIESSVNYLILKIGKNGLHGTKILGILNTCKASKRFNCYRIDKKALETYLLFMEEMRNA